MEGGMCAGFYHFVLVHGDGQGAWCWYKVVTLLRSKGHTVTALDMASCGRDPNQPEDVPTITDYFKPLMLFIETLPIDEKVILVGHSHGGIGIAFAMESFPQKIAVAVFVTAEMPCPHFDSQAIKNEFVRRQISTMDSEIIYGHGKDKPPTAILVGPKLMETKLFDLSPPEDLTLATLSVRPSPLFNDSQSSNETALTEQNYGSVRRVFVICEKDKMLSQEFQMWLIENNPPDDVKVINDSDHMVMVSKPDELCLCLLEIACKYS